MAFPWVIDVSTASNELKGWLYTANWEGWERMCNCPFFRYCMYGTEENCEKPSHGML